MATFRFEVNNKPTKNKTYNILLCITVDGKRKRLKTSVDLKRRSDFNTQAGQLDSPLRTELQSVECNSRRRAGTSEAEIQGIA